MIAQPTQNQPQKRTGEKTFYTESAVRNDMKQTEQYVLNVTQENFTIKARMPVKHAQVELIQILLTVEFINILNHTRVIFSSDYFIPEN